jgi:hypothetical protein
LSYDYSHMKLANSEPILAEVAFLIFGRSSATPAQKDAEPGLSADTQQKLGIKLHKAIRWEKTRSGLS